MNKILKYLRLILLATTIFLFIYLFNEYGLNGIKENIDSFGIFVPIAIFVLRSSSIIIPALPGTAYSILAGTLLGFQNGYIVICLSDLFSCSIAFTLSKKYGKLFLSRVLGKKFIYKIEKFSSNRVENNIFLMTSILMTGFFDFACYAIGLTKTSLKKFSIALIISIMISNIPIVALGAGILSQGKIILLFGILGMLLLSVLNNRLNKINLFSNE